MQIRNSLMIVLFPLFSAVVLQAVGGLANGQVQSCSVEVQTPKDGETVSRTTRVEGLATIPPGTFLWILGHPKEQALWWPKGGRAAVITEGRWAVTAMIGQGPEPGRPVELAAVVVNADTNRDLIGWVKETQRTGSYPGIQLPATLPACEIQRVSINQPKDRLSITEAKSDVDQFFSTLERVHPNLLAKVNKQDYQKLKQQTLSDISARLDKDGKVKVQDLAYSLYYAAAYFKDGHTSVGRWPRTNPSDFRGKRFPPFWLDSENGRFLIATAADRSLLRAEILAVNGVPIASFLKPALDRNSGETLAFKAARFVGNQVLWFYMTDLFRDDSYTLKLRDEAGAEREQTVRTVGVEQFEEVAPREQREQRTHVEFIDGARIARLVYPAFRESDAEKHKIDEIFRQIKDRGTADLIIDLRGNGGGTSAMVQYIFPFLYDGKFWDFSIVRKKISPELLAAFESESGPAGQMGKVVTYHGEEERFPKPATFFTGRSYLLIDNGTFSSATEFATMFRDYKVGKSLGYETGGVPICFGDSLDFTLKNSGIVAVVSHKQFFPPKPKPGDDEHGMLPDIPTSAELLAPYRKEADPVLAYTVGYIRKAREK